MRYKMKNAAKLYAGLWQKHSILREMSLHMLLENFIRGEDDQRDLERDLFDLLGVELSSKCSVILLISILNSDAFADKAKVVRHVENVFKRHFRDCSLIIFFNIDGNIGCFIIPNNLLEEDARQLGSELLAEIVGYADKACDELARAGILVKVSSSSVQSDLKPKQLYREALIVFDHCNAAGLRVATPADLPVPQPGSKNEMALWERRYMSSIIARDFYGAVSTLDKIIDMMIGESLSTLEHIRSSLFNRLETVLAICGVDLHPERQAQEVGFASESIMRAESFGELKDCVYDFFAILDDCCGANNELSKLAKIKEFVMNNYKDSSMGAARICEEFKFSSSYLSRLFKNEAGSSVVAFIHQVRMDKAKQLLEDTDMKINDVGLAAGFANRWTFIRAFRSLENMSPSDYRNSFRR